MDYRELPRGGGKVSTVGLGAGRFQNATDREIKGMIAYAMDHGVNLMDAVMYEDSTAAPVARALKGKRSKMRMQIHIGAIYPDGVYTRTRTMSKVMKGFELELEKYGTDYADIGLIHYVDDDDDFGEIDLFMLSVNPTYDFEPREGKVVLSRERQDLYRECQKRGIDIGSVNKYFDLAKAGDELAHDHYKRLGKHASDCVKCGGCETNCPFHVSIRSRLEEAASFFVERCIDVGAKKVWIVDRTCDDEDDCYKVSLIERYAKDSGATMLPANRSSDYHVAFESIGAMTLGKSVFAISPSRRLAGLASPT